MTFGAQAGALASQPLAGGASISYVVDLSTKFEGQIQLKNTGGATVGTTNGLQIQAFRSFGAGPTYDTSPVTAFTIPTTAGLATYKSFALPTGKYQISLTNLDAANAITVESTLSTLDSVA
jgi:hypothetical protein